MDPAPVRLLNRLKVLQDIDIHFAELLCRLAGRNASAGLLLGTALVSSITTDEKHVCLDLTAYADKPLSLMFPDLPEERKAEYSVYRSPALTQWTDELLGSTVVGLPGEYRPLILDQHNRLYLYRYWYYEQQLAASIRQRLTLTGPAVNRGILQAGLKRYFPSTPVGPDWQKIAAFTALTKNCCVIAGGPGTGKTFSVTRILALLLEQNQQLAIKLCAPTGKAAARIQESVRRAKEHLDCAGQIMDGIPEETHTIHRLLGYSPAASSFLHNRHNPLAADVVIVDEASMVPLTLMAKLMQAIPEHAKIILLGDKDQLASVEAGAILSDICEASEINHFSSAFCRDYQEVTGEQMSPAYHSDHPTLLANCTVELQQSYRFDAAQGIGALSRAVNRGDADLAAELMSRDTIGTLSHDRLPPLHRLEDGLERIVALHYERAFTAQSVQDAQACFEAFQILCSHRRGPYGADALNRLVEKILMRKRSISPRTPFYKGRPIMITRNDYNLKLFNGDTGVVWNAGNADHRIYFSNQDKTFRTFSPGRLPEHETVYAMTVHKSQGSEFDEVLLILPDQAVPVVSRELLYTALTRARKKVTIWCSAEVFKAAVGRVIQRTSGLRDALSREA